MLLFNASGVAVYVAANYTVRPVPNKEGIGFACASVIWGVAAVAVEFSIRQKMRETEARLQILEQALRMNGKD